LLGGLSSDAPGDLGLHLEFQDIADLVGLFRSKLLCLVHRYLGEIVGDLLDDSLDLEDIDLTGAHIEMDADIALTAGCAVFPVCGSKGRLHCGNDHVLWQISFRCQLRHRDQELALHMPTSSYTTSMFGRPDTAHPIRQIHLKNERVGSAHSFDPFIVPLIGEHCPTLSTPKAGVICTILGHKRAAHPKRAPPLPEGLTINHALGF
jgi:hypothetical protein